MSDPDLLLATRRADDDEAYAALLRAAMRQMQTLAHRMLGRFPRVARWEETDDVVQNAMLRLHRALGTVEPGDIRNVAGLVATQVRRELIDLARHHRGPTSAARHHDTAVIHTADGSHDRIAAAADVDETPDSVDAWARFHATADRLPEMERELFHLVWHLGLSQPEVAAILGESSRTIKRRWKRVKDFLRSHGDMPPLAD
jgi:RNA polymerase sigma factor (sigma-70 family)